LTGEFPDYWLIEFPRPTAKLASDIGALLGFLIDGADWPRVAFQFAMHRRAMHAKPASNFGFGPVLFEQFA
jgi:hypothetical protein